MLSQAKSVAKAQRKTMSILLIACSLLWSKSFSPERLAVTLRFVVEATARVQRDLPLSEMDVKLHNLLHLVHKITVSGPLWVTSMFAYESMWKTLGKWATNTARVEATMIRKYSDFEYAAWRYLQDPQSFSPNVLGRFPELDVQVSSTYWFPEAGMNDSVTVKLLGAGVFHALRAKRDIAKAQAILVNLHLHYVR
jgi:hypothetical protein